MAGSTDFVPSREADLVTWSNNFNAKITATPTAYGLVAAQATAYTALHTAFTTAYQTANNPATRSPMNVTAKNAAKAALVDGPGGIRVLARIVQAAPAVTATQKSELGLTVRDADPSPIPPPDFAPDVDIVSTFGRTVKIRLHDSHAAPGRRGKPAGVDGATVFSYVGTTPPADLAAWKFEGNTTRTFMDIEFPATVANGATVWFTAAWFNPRAQSGPNSMPVSTNIPGGLAQAA